MDLQDLKTEYYFFNPTEFGKVFVLVDFGNVRPWAKDLWPEENKFKISIEVDIEKLAGVCNWVSPIKKFFYYGYFEEDGTFMGKFPKCNFDVEMTMTMLQKIDKYDSIMLFSGDSDFGGLLGYLKSKGKKVIVVCTRNRMSKELETVADKFVPAETLAKFLQYIPKQTRPSR